MTTSACPAEGDLKQYRLGRLPEARAVEVDRHVSGCAVCVTRLGAMPSDDPLLTALRAQKGRPPLRNPLLDGIRQEVRTQPQRAPSAIPVAVAIPVSASPTPTFRLDKRWLIASGVSSLLLILIVILASSGKKKPKEDDEGDRNPFRVENNKSRPKAKLDGPRAADPVALALNLPTDRAFKETWVSKPAAIEGVKTWCIESRLAQLTYPSRLEITEDERLLIRYVPPAGQAWWYQFDPSTNGLTQGPYSGTYTTMTPNARMCARVVSEGVQLWEEGGPQAWVTLRSAGPFFQPSFSTDNDLLVIFDDAGNATSKELNFYKVRDGSKIAQCSLSDMTLSSTVHAWSPDGSTLAVSMGRGIALIEAPWDKVARKIARPSHVSALSWSPGGKHLATSESDRHVHVIDVESGESVLDLMDWKTSSADFIPAWSPEGKELALGTDDSRVVVWDFAKKKRTFSFAGHTKPITTITFLGDGKTLISGSRGSLRFWDLSSNQYRGSLLCFGIGEWVAISPEGDYRTAVHPNTERRLHFKSREETDTLRDFYSEEFQTLYGRKNSPEKVRLVGD